MGIWYISAGQLTIGTTIALNNDGSATLGKLAIATTGAISSTNFNIDVMEILLLAGNVTATGGTIGGWADIVVVYNHLMEIYY